MSLWARLRDLRYAVPGRVGVVLPAPDAPWAARQRLHLARRGIAVTFGWFQGAGCTPADVLAANLALADGLGDGDYLSIKAPAMEFDAARIAVLIERLGQRAVFDAHGPALADATLDLARRHGVGAVLPARWSRSVQDAAGLRDGPGMVRLVKGEWADPAGDPPNLEAAYLALADRLSGRAAPVAVATHDPHLAARALTMLQRAGTPCWLEQLRGLPGRRCLAVARRLGVPVRHYVPVGPGWWPYAIDKALARPHLPIWWLRDRLG